MSTESTTGATPATDLNDRLGHGSSPFDEMHLPTVEPHEVLDNPVLGHQYRLLRRDTDDAGEFLQSEFRFDADASHFDAHIHPEQDETIRVLLGQFEVVVGEDRRTLGSGEEITLPAGVPHYHGNVAGVETRVFHEIRPPMDFEEGLRMFCELAAAGKTKAKGGNLVATAVFLDAHPRQLYMATPSIGVQNVLISVLAPLGRRLGYAAEYPPSASRDAA
jgi:quercetin dioxygenase-like cupin family protein